MVKNKLSFLLLAIMLLQLSSCAQEQKNSTAMANNKFPIQKTDDQWKQQLTDEQYYILREKGTERAFTSKFYLHKEEGNYKCAGCGTVLFNSESKFDAHCGWPSFDKEIEKGTIIYEEDNSHGMKRVEIMCAKCGGHLGHVFDDGPTKTGLRFCVNGGSLSFEPMKDALVEKQRATTQSDTVQIVLGGGCFWCIEAVYQRLQGIIKVESGYEGGNVSNPTYKQVCTGTTNHAEVARLTYNTKQTSFEEILKVFFTVHDPTTLNKQGNDEGTQYRSVIFYDNEEQKKQAQEIISALDASGAYDNKIVTTLEPAAPFYKAEDYHQDYYNQNGTQPYCLFVVKPKVDKFEKVFKDRLKK
jgi:peptide methionine sulfoxide reductase msrA/msrB